MYGEVLKLGRWKYDLPQPGGGIVKWARHFSGGPSHGYLSTSLLHERCMVNTCGKGAEHCMCNTYVFTCVHIVPSDIEVLETHYTHMHQVYLQRHVYITIKVATPRDYMFSTEGGKRSLNGWMFMVQGGRAGGVSHTVTPEGNQAPGLRLLMHKYLPPGRTPIWPLWVQRVLQRRHSQTKVILYGSASDPDTILPASAPCDEE